MTFSDQDITDYVLGRLPADKLEAFDQQMRSDENFKKRIHMEQLIYNGIQEFGKDQFKQRVRMVVRQRDLARRRRWLYLVIGLVTLALASWFFFKSTPAPALPATPNVIYAQAYEKPALLSGTRSQGSSQDLEQLRTAYAASNYEEIIARTNNPMTWKDLPEVALMRMIALMETQKFEEAAKISTTITTSDMRFDDHIQWYSALSHLRSDRDEEAYNMMHSIVQDHTHDHYEDALNILKQ